MTVRILLGVDVGTTSLKAVATDGDGRLVREGAVRYPTATDADGGAEQDADVWWRALCEIAPRVVAGDEVVAVAVTSQAPTLVPVDADGAAVGPAFTWLDRRAQADAARVAAVAPGRNGADAFFGTAKLPWLARERPAIADAAHRVVSANGYIVARLGGAVVLDDTSASLMQGFDEESSSFPAALREAVAGLDLLPETVASSTVVGAVSASSAAATGITLGARVIAGAIDAVGSALEAGVLAPGGPLIEMTGFSSVSMLAVPSGTAVPGFIHARHCVPGTDLLIAAQVTAGATVDWVNALDPAHDLRDDPALATRSRPSRLTFATPLAGERTPTWNPRARGILDGIDLGTDGVELLLAALEGNALALAGDVVALGAHGYPVAEVLATGGGARSDLWLQIKADALGVPVHRAERGHGAAQGASYLAGAAAGEYRLDEVVAGGGIETTFHPDPDRHAAYRAKLAWADRIARLNAER
ncbi:FGGY family carbohydrate kinase [Microbacterium betulae]|uniref:FGGY family carbohydrate kinase n=1 Tax=Microbacterium betulae TaxID=2981139 RepID=A0AA97I892_9MICO|nr:FGGY family carbohydrate kinase [Microbacterium sp. AB]WOF24270.1 FGGY family carbohydrate kinase [Microbacterium sp. AB]